jgi:hypothetical protein
MRTAISIVVSIAHISSRLTGGYSIKYQEYNLKERTKQRLTLVHSLLSFILAFGITNNYLNEFQFFNERFAASSFWTIGTAFLLLIILMIAIGSAITMLTSKWK